MAKHGKRYREALKKVDRSRLYPAGDSISLLKGISSVKFDETVELSVRLGIDPKRSEQSVRGTVILPYGTGKTPKVLAFAKGDKAKEAKEAGADYVGDTDLIEKVKEGWSEFDVVVATPDIMGLIGKSLGRVLGPRMPNPKAGTLSFDIGTVIKEIKSGKVQYRADKFAIVHSSIGKISFTEEALIGNLVVFVDALIRAKPAAAKGQYLKSIVISSTMSPGIKLDPAHINTLVLEKQKVSV
ncbi:MAG TPA: 50S ribosomal protein L1 [Candidatus Eremiobacteraeota bacterium]|nr:MAG: 50S ribosomal protein L1 [bacterium ADurb.Bin363]HPZ09073.1 50S ribosomal protein L1 [Candidatus Eremiobacteraeota bacterium]